MDNTSYYTREYEYQPHQSTHEQDQNQLMPILVLVLLGLGIGTVIALLAAQNRKPKRTDLIGQIEDRLKEAEKELNKLGRKLEYRIKELQS